MTDLNDLIARLQRADEYEPVGHDAWEAAAALEALRAENADLIHDLGRAQSALSEFATENERLRKAAERALKEAVADDMDEWFAELRAALTRR